MHRDKHHIEQRWEMAEQSAGFGVWDLDVANQRVHYSPQWKAMLGYADVDEPDSTQTWRSRVHPDDLQPMLSALNGHLEGAEPSYEKEFRLRTIDGSYRWVLSRGRVVERDEAGQALRAIGTLTDLTTRRHAERMRLERDRAEAASRAKSEFLSRMSHELRTPLNAVLGFSQLLSQKIGGIDVHEQRRYVEHIEHAGWRLLEMIDGVLDLSCIQSGHLTLDTEHVPLAPLVQSALDTMAPLAQQHAVNLHKAVLPPHAAVRADAAKLQQVLEQLLRNAIRFNQRGGSVGIAVASAQDAWRLSVTDTGRGIPTLQIPQLFEPFNRVGRGTAGEGTGIGLALARSLVEAMGGKISVQSTEGDGSAFHVMLPMDRTRTDAAA
jgi:PAS domain S-box-containing protein